LPVDIGDLPVHFPVSEQSKTKDWRDAAFQISSLFRPQEKNAFIVFAQIFLHLWSTSKSPNKKVNTVFIRVERSGP
jgi:hypothetical protein